MPHRTAVRAATSADVPDLVGLCLEARAEAGTGSALCTDDGTRLRGQLTTALGLPGAFLLVAQHGDQTDGLLLGRTVGPTLFADHVAVDLEALYVRAAARRRGVGHALLVALVAVADAAGATEVVAAPLPGARGVQRFLARAGFQAAASYRVVTVAALRRRLAVDQPRTVRPVSGAITRLVALRRQILATGELPAVQDDGVEEPAATTRQVSRAVQTRRPAESSTVIS
ncbi:MAG: GNAT family N-acetyltransferase [Micrococcales bacterium]|nr:GNAT family N-acetyltransferase [Micrococcales bacterium]